jgi:hypothetical protein
MGGCELIGFRSSAGGGSVVTTAQLLLVATVFRISSPASCSPGAFSYIYCPQGGGAPLNAGLRNSSDTVATYSALLPGTALTKSPTTHSSVGGHRSRMQVLCKERMCKQEKIIPVTSDALHVSEGNYLIGSSQWRSPVRQASPAETKPPSRFRFMRFLFSCSK